MARSTPTSRTRSSSAHALTLDQYVASEHPVTRKPGWWEAMVGPGKPIDTDRFFVICPNILGGCMGSTGPASLNPKTGQALGPRLSRHHHRRHGRRPGAFDRPARHRAAFQRGRRLDGRHAGARVGRASPRARFTAMPIATAAWHSSQNIAFHEVGRQAVMADPDWCQGRYLEFGKVPRNGLAVARMAAHITYLSEEALHRKFGRSLQDLAAKSVQLQRRFPGGELSAPSGLHVRRPLRCQQLPLHHPGHGLFRPCGRARRCSGQRASRARKTRFCVVSFTSDWLYPTRESREIVQALECGGRQRQLRRDRVRQGSRRLPAGRAGAVRHHSRLPQRGGRQARSKVRAGEVADARPQQAGASTASTIC